MPNAYISGTGFYVPPRVVTNDDLVEQYGIDTSHEWIVKRTGIEARRYADEGVSTADLGFEAAKDALESAGIEAKDLDMILFATLSPEMAFPAAAASCKRCSASVMRAASFPPWTSATSVWLPLRPRNGDVVHSVWRLQEHPPRRCRDTLRGDRPVNARPDGLLALRRWRRGRGRVRNRGRPGHPKLVPRGRWPRLEQPVPAGLEHEAAPVHHLERRRYRSGSARSRCGRLDGRQVFKNAVERMVLGVMQACWDQGLTVDDIDLFAFHQANMRINQFVANQLNIPEEKLLHNIQKYGNTTAGTIPILLAEAEREGRLKPGTKLATAAFGSGFTWGSAIIDW